MTTPTRYSDYDPFAWVYNRHWGDFLLEKIFPVLDQLVLQALPRLSRVLDVCCGAGHLAHALSERGFHVTGIDRSEEMLRYARESAPAVEFLLADARRFEVPNAYMAAVSTSDSFNHIIDLDDLTQVLSNVYASLDTGGYFFIDMAIEEWYAKAPPYLVLQGDDHLCAIRFSYDPRDRIRRNDHTTFRLADGLWERADFHLVERAYREEEIRSALQAVGFHGIRIHNAQTDFGLEENQAGRRFFTSRKP